MAELKEVAARLAPHNLEAEMSVLSALLISEESLAELVHLLQPEDFYKVAHQVVFQTVQELAEANKQVDHVTVAESLERKKRLDEIGGRPYLFLLADSLPSTASARYHAEIVRNHGTLRRLIGVANELASRAFEAREEAMELLDEAERKIFELARKGEIGEPQPLAELLHETFERIERFRQRQGGTTGVPTGFHDLDSITAGLQPGELIVIAARPSMGKTSFAINLMTNAAMKGYGAGFFSLEMSAQQVMQNLLCCRARVDAHKLRRGFISKADYQQLKEGGDDISDKKVFIDETSILTPLSVRAKARRLKAKHDIQMVIIDYLQLMSAGSRYDNRAQEIAVISRSLKSLAKELEVPVVAISQLNRSVEQRDTHRPRMSDLRESGAIEQDADVIMMVHREDYYKETNENRGVAEIIVAKQRNGPTGEVRLRFAREFMRFESLLTRAEPLG